MTSGLQSPSFGNIQASDWEVDCKKAPVNKFAMLKWEMTKCKCLLVAGGGHDDYCFWGWFNNRAKLTEIPAVFFAFRNMLIRLQDQAKIFQLFVQRWQWKNPEVS